MRALSDALNGRERENVWNIGRVLWSATLRVIVTITKVASHNPMDSKRRTLGTLPKAKIIIGRYNPYFEQVRELIAMKSKSEEGTATIWLTTAEMGFSLTEEQDAVVCTKDVREGKVND